jgi:hypothetical protein
MNNMSNICDKNKYIHYSMELKGYQPISKSSTNDKKNKKDNKKKIITNGNIAQNR